MNTMLASVISAVVLAVQAAAIMADPLPMPGPHDFTLCHVAWHYKNATMWRCNDRRYDTW